MENFQIIISKVYFFVYSQRKVVKLTYLPCLTAYLSVPRTA